MGTPFAKRAPGEPAMKKLSQRLATLSIPSSLFGISSGPLRYPPSSARSGACSSAKGVTWCAPDESGGIEKGDLDAVGSLFVGSARRDDPR
jgi:hypothetical protein